jgi:hypothetical protein
MPDATLIWSVGTFQGERHSAAQQGQELGRDATTDFGRAMGLAGRHGVNQVKVVTHNGRAGSVVRYSEDIHCLIYFFV